MTTRLFALTLTFFFQCFLQAQEKTVLNNQDGIFVTYELTKIEETSKKDTYLAVVKAENKNDYDVFYGIPLTKAANGTITISALQNKSFAQTNIRNGTGLFGDNASLTGIESKFFTNDNKILFSISKGNFITSEKQFKVKKGVKPIITNTFLIPCKSLDYFDLALNEATINGEWISSCGNMQMTLSLLKDPKGEIAIQQFINGKQNIWRKINTNVFEKLNDRSATLSFNKQASNFNYTTTDGVSCTWIKK